jgi:hypothetical protein
MSLATAENSTNVFCKFQHKILECYALYNKVPETKRQSLSAQLISSL